MLFRSLANFSIALIVGCQFLPSARAQLLGDSVQCSGASSDWIGLSCSSFTAIVSSSPAEFLLVGADGSPVFIVNVGPSSIAISPSDRDFTVPIISSTPGVLTISDLDFSAGQVISGVSLAEAGALGVGVSTNGITFTGNSVSINLFSAESSAHPGRVFWAVGQTATIDLTLTTPIPEPETYAMLLAGLGLLGFEARRRKKLQRPA